MFFLKYQRAKTEENKARETIPENLIESIKEEILKIFDESSKKVTIKVITENKIFLESTKLDRK